ncbi:hypothetical protein Taro_027791 [Colocasia esculenta]|uniref:Uncharacterized protein n=1 Tax=Colocasia esculenta TaxID=4460 RepID=A0A843VL62_COLES|nr:hypothetical protein [Colocasia esculenta]
MASSFPEERCCCTHIYDLGSSSRTELNTTFDRHDWPTPCGCPARDSRDRGRRYYEKIFETGRSLAGITILECEMKVFRPQNDVLSPKTKRGRRASLSANSDFGSYKRFR